MGCLVKVKIPDNKKKKSGPKKINAIFIGYTSDNNANRFLLSILRLVP